MQFSQNSCHFALLRFKYSPQHSVLKHSDSILHSYCQRLYFASIQNYNQNYYFLYIIYMCVCVCVCVSVFIQQMRRQRILD
jgi:hypothetical protein